MHEKRYKEQAIMWCDPDLGDLEVLRATYITHSFARHAHETFTIGLIERGAGAFVSRGATHVAEASNIFIIHPEEVHNGYAAAPTGWTYRVVYPDAAVLQHILSEQTGEASMPSFLSQTIIKDERLGALLLSLHSLLEQSSGRLERESALQTMLMHLIAHHADHAPGLRPVGREHGAVSRVQDYLRANLRENISLQSLADLVHLHPSYLLRTFHAQVGLPPHAYLTHLRVQQARTLLRDGMSLAQVALELGFADQSHFARHFRHLVGVTPGHYARQSRGSGRGPAAAPPVGVAPAIDASGKASRIW